MDNVASMIERPLPDLYSLMGLASPYVKRVAPKVDAGPGPEDMSVLQARRRPIPGEPFDVFLARLAALDSQKPSESESTLPKGDAVERSLVHLFSRSETQTTVESLDLPSHGPVEPEDI